MSGRTQANRPPDIALTGRNDRYVPRSAREMADPFKVIGGTGGDGGGHAGAADRALLIRFFFFYSSLSFSFAIPSSLIPERDYPG